MNRNTRKAEFFFFFFNILETAFQKSWVVWLNLIRIGHCFFVSYCEYRFTNRVRFSKQNHLAYLFVCC